MKQEFALSLYARSRLSLGKARELAGMSLAEALRPELDAGGQACPGRAEVTASP